MRTLFTIAISFLCSVAHGQSIAIPGASVQWYNASGISDYTNGIDVWFATDTISNKVNGANLAANDWTNVPGANPYSFSAINGSLTYLTGISPKGKPSVRTLISGGVGQWAKAPLVTNTQPYYEFFVFWTRTNSASGNKGLIDGYNSGRGDFFDSATSGSYQFFAGVQGNAGARDTQMHITYRVVNGASSSYQYFGGSANSVSYGTQKRDGVIIFNDTTQSDTPDADIFEWRVYTNAPTAGQVTQILNYLSFKYGINQ